MKRLQLAIESNLGDVSLVGVAVHRVCQQLGFDDARAGQVELCVVEAVTNAIRHAYHGASGRQITITLAADHDHLLIEVCDTGSAMPDEHQQRLLLKARTSESSHLDRQSIPEGGRGLEIICELMDEVSYRSENSLNRLLMTKRF